MPGHGGSDGRRGEPHGTAARIGDTSREGSLVLQSNVMSSPVVGQICSLDESSERAAMPPCRVVSSVLLPRRPPRSPAGDRVRSWTCPGQTTTPTVNRSVVPPRSAGGVGSARAPRTGTRRGSYPGDVLGGGGGGVSGF